MSITDVIVRTYRPGDEDKIVELLVKGFNGWPKFDLDCPPRDHWNWKFIDNPTQQRQITVAETNNQIVCCDHTLFNTVKIGEETQLSGQAADSTTHPDYRGRGIYKKLRKFDEETDHLQSPSNFVYSSSANPIIIKEEDKIGSSRFPYPILRWVRIRDINYHLRNHDLTSKILLKSEYRAAKSINLVENLLSKAGKSRSRLKIVNINRFDERFESFWNKIKDDYNFILERSTKYLNWRFCDHRGGNYVIRQAEEDGEIVGYIVLRVNRYEREYPTGYVVELCTLPDRLDCADALIAEAISYFDDSKINMVSYIISKGHPYESRFKRFGFLDSRNNIYVGYHYNKISKEYSKMENSPPDKILFQFGDIDWI